MPFSVYCAIRLRIVAKKTMIIAAVLGAVVIGISVGVFFMVHSGTGKCYSGMYVQERKK